MGMAAHQSRFLALTSRQNSIGLQLTRLSAEKMSLARDTQKISKKYNDALNRKVLTWSNNSGVNYSTLSYKTVMSPNSLNGNTPYYISDNNGKIVLDSKYAKYAKLISPDGAPVSGSWKNCAERNNILCELLGVDADDWSFANYKASGNILSKSTTDGYNKGNAGINTDEFYEWYAKRMFCAENKISSYDDNKLGNAYTSFMATVDEKTVIYSDSNNTNVVTPSVLDYYEYKSEQTKDYEYMLQFYTGLSDYYANKLEISQAEHDAKVENGETGINKDAIDWTKFDSTKVINKLVNDWTDTIYEALGGATVFNNKELSDSKEKESLNYKLLRWLSCAEDYADINTGKGTNEAFWMKTSEEWDDGKYGVAVSKLIVEQLCKLLKSNCSSSTYDKLSSLLVTKSNGGYGAGSTKYGNFSVLLKNFYKQITLNYNSNDKDINPHGAITVTNKANDERGGINIEDYVYNKDSKYLVREMIRAAFDTVSLDLNENNYNDYSSIIDRYAEQLGYVKANQTVEDHWEDKENQPLYDEVTAQLSAGDSNTTTMYDKYQTALDNRNTIFTADQLAQIEFYDKIFEAIFDNGWVENNRVTDNEYLNNALQNNMYTITTQTLVEGNEYQVAYYDLGVNNVNFGTTLNQIYWNDKNMTQEKLEQLVKSKSRDGLEILSSEDHYTYSTDLASNFDKIFTVSDSDASAEALSEYEYQKALIKAKESKIDTRMQNLETEQAAISERKKSLEAMLKENVERLNVFTA